MRIAIIGAGGFVGTRAVEYLLLSRKADVRGIVRTYSGLARMSRFDCDWRVADATDSARLTEALSGCDVVVNAISGDNSIMARSAGTVHQAAMRAGVGRIILISSATVHGVRPPTDSDESSALSPTGLGAYPAAKLRCEKELRRLTKSGGPDLVVLRPSIIIGPRSYWVYYPAGELLSGYASLADGGHGICNSIYVDNLIDAILLAATTPSAGGETFLLADDGCPTWLGYYQKLAALLGVPATAIHSVPLPVCLPASLRSRLAGLGTVPVFRAAMLLTPSFLKNQLRRQLGLAREKPISWILPGENPRAAVPPEIAELHSSEWRINSERARLRLGFRPTVSVDEAISRSVEWLRYAGIAPRY